MVFKLACTGMWFFISTMNFQLHEFYVSVSHISEEESSGKLVWDCRMFKDDFEKAIISTTGRRPDWLYSNEDSVDRQTLIDYFSRHTQLSANGHLLNLELTDCLVEGDGPTTTISCNFITKETPLNFKMIKVTCSLLTDALDDQVNMIHVELNGIRKSKNLNSHRQTLEVVFN